MLVDDGIPFNITTTNAFRTMIQIVSGRHDLTTLSRDSFNNLLDGDFDLFTNSVKELVQQESKHMYGQPYLNLLHDAWTSSAKEANIAFIDSLWQFRHIALLAT